MKNPRIHFVENGRTRTSRIYARWNKTIGHNTNALRVITGFKKEDSLARTKLQVYVAWRNGDPNAGRTGGRSCKSEESQRADTTANISRSSSMAFWVWITYRNVLNITFVPLKNTLLLLIILIFFFGLKYLSFMPFHSFVFNRYYI